MKERQIKKISIFGIIGNLFLLIIKFSIGKIFNSQSMIADATNSAGDIFASLMVFIGNKISTEPADDDHNVGHGKAEYIFSLYIGLTMIAASLLVIIKSIKNIYLNTTFIYSNLLVLACVVTITIKLSLYIYTKLVYKKTSNILAKSLYKDHRNDILIALITLVSIILSKYNIYFFDAVGGIIISCYIIYTGFRIVDESYKVLMDQSIDRENQSKIEDIINKYPKVNIGTISSIPIGYKYIVVLTIYVNEDMRVIDAHKITKDLQKKIKQKVKIVDRVVIHVNPIVKQNNIPNKKD